jgi:hypothetical protein
MCHKLLGLTGKSLSMDLLCTAAAHLLGSPLITRPGLFLPVSGPGDVPTWNACALLDPDDANQACFSESLPAQQ